MTRARLLFFVAVLCAAACGLSKVGTGEAANDPLEGGATGADAEANADGASAFDADVVDGSALGPPIFATTATDLYRFQPETLAVDRIGPLAGCNDITDIALDQSGKLYAGGNGLFVVDTNTGACTSVSNVTQPFTLAVVPIGALYPANEALVAFLGADYVEVDSGAGTRRTVTQLAINPYQPSGDVVAEIDAGMYVSVVDSTCPTDCILQVKPSDGSIMQNWGPSGSKGVVGLAMAKGVLYGFLTSGDIVRFTFSGANVTSMILPTKSKPVWIGAGSRSSP